MLLLLYPIFELCRITAKFIDLMQNKYETCGHADLQGNNFIRGLGL